MPDLALFDFDNTITVNDNYTPFIHFSVPKYRIIAGVVLLAPFIAAYKIGALPATKMRTMVTMLGMRGRSEGDVRQLGLDYGTKHLPGVLRPEALERITWHQGRGDTVVVVSASLDVYLARWCENVGVDLICTMLEVRDGKLTGRYLGGDCTCHEKARRVRERYDLNAYGTIYAYGDSKEDEAMLALANKRFFQWKEC